MDLRNRSPEGIPERIDPSDLPTEPAHLARYLFAGHWVPGRRVTDLGCGTGYGCRLLAAAGAASVEGVDVNAAIVREAQSAFGRPTVHFTLADAASPLPMRSADVLVCFEVVEHVREPHGLLGNAAAALAKDGVFLVSTPNAGAFVGGHSGNPYHLREYTLAEFTTLLQSHFSSVSMYFQWWYRDPYDIRWNTRELLRLLLPLPLKHALGKAVCRNHRLGRVAARPPHASAFDFRPFPLSYLGAPGWRGAQPSVWVAVCQGPHSAPAGV